MATPARAPAQPKKKFRKKTFFVVLLVLLLVLAGSGYAVTRIMTGPSVGTVVQTLPTVIRQDQVELKQFDGTLFSFAHPITYIEQAVRRQPNAADLESHTFLSSGMVSKVLTTVVSKLPSGRVEDDPSYQVRVKDKTKYQLQEIVVKNEKVAIFTSVDSQQIQQAAFWAHKDKLLTFTLSGVATDLDTTRAEYRAMVETLAWR